MITNSKIARSLLVPISSIINACFCCSEDKKLRGFTFANCKSLLWEEGDEKKIFGIVGTGFRKWFFKHLEMRNQDTIMNTHLILQKLTLDPFKTGFHFGISIWKFSGSNCESNCDWFQIVICKKAKLCLITILHGT